MPEFWETAYSSNERMWGEQPTDNARTVLALMEKHKVKSILIPGFGYGRNAKVFYEKGIDVTGIEISETAIERARKHFGKEVTIHQGAVVDMPFDENLYQSVYCYSLLHLLNKAERKKLIADCYNQLVARGIMVFVALSANDKRFGVGEEIEKNTFHAPYGLNLHFYDKASVTAAFSDYNIIDLKEIKEPEENPTEIHWMVVCQKK
ncbi:MAG: class I SAM-dependent methyltransferase [Bacteroidetes bacterium]|nr:class I SAM-dependent methyltransferase [Bacteroidota bacterium]